MRTTLYNYSQLLIRGLITIVVAYIMAKLILRNPMFPFVLMCGGLYCVFALKYPRYHFYFYLLTIVSFLGYFNLETFIRVPGAFKIYDLLFFMTVSLFFIRKLQENFIANHLKSVPRFKIAEGFLWVLFLIAIFQIIFTSSRYDLSLISCFKAGRNYLFVFVGVFAMQYFPSKEEAAKIVKFIFIMAIMQSLLVILQNIIPGVHFLGFTKIIDQSIGEHQVRRVYIPAMLYVMAVFSMSFCMLNLKTKIFSKRFLLGAFFCSGAAILLSYTRTLWMSAVLSIGLSSLFFAKRIFYKGIIIVPVVVILGISVLFAGGGKGLNILKTRVASIYDEIYNYNGNFAYRFEENIKRLDLIKENIVIGGPGFVHTNDAPDVFNFHSIDKGRSAYVQTNDSGTLTWLLSFGVVGVVWVIFLLFWMLRSAKKSIAVKNDEAGIIVGVAAYVSSVWLTSLTTTGFTFYPGTVALGVFVYICAVFTKDMDRGGCQSS